MRIPGIDQGIRVHGINVLEAQGDCFVEILIYEHRSDKVGGEKDIAKVVRDTGVSQRCEKSHEDYKSHVSK